MYFEVAYLLNKPNIAETLRNFVHLNDREKRLRFYWKLLLLFGHSKVSSLSSLQAHLVTLQPKARDRTSLWPPIFSSPIERDQSTAIKTGDEAMGGREMMKILFRRPICVLSRGLAKKAIILRDIGTYSRFREGHVTSAQRVVQIVGGYRLHA